jgi:hypothetical protein
MRGLFVRTFINFKKECEGSIGTHLSTCMTTNKLDHILSFGRSNQLSNFAEYIIMILLKFFSEFSW